MTYSANSALFFEPSFDGEIVDDLSFVVLRENKLESYVISLKSNDNGIILQQLASSKETKKELNLKEQHMCLIL